MAEILRHCAIVGWAAEHFEVDSRNLAGMSLHNSVLKLMNMRQSLVPVEQELGLGLRQPDPHALAPPLQGCLNDNQRLGEVASLAMFGF